MTCVWKVLTAPQWAALQVDGSFAGARIDLADGYIHLSTQEQLPETLEKHFAGQCDLHLVAVDCHAMGEAVRWEPSRGGALFPHLYAPLPMAAVAAHGLLTYALDGKPVLPKPVSTFAAGT